MFAIEERLTELRLTNYGSRPAKDYNSAVNDPVPPKPVPGNEHKDDSHRNRHSIYAAEASGLLLIAILLFVLTVIRYWRYIPWSAR
jgi:hypothetical protein